jgi:hypothetical protein
VTGFASPDLPAYWCYAIVFAVGALVSASVVNQLLSQYPDRWAFAGTLTLFAAHMCVPVVLFWFLDYTGALHDTSLFAALVVAIGYKQIFAGGIQGITLPGQTSRLWQPFEAWVKGVGDRVQQQQKLHLDRFTEAVKIFIRATPSRMETFEALVRARTKDYSGLDKALSDIRAMPPEAGIDARALDRLWSELRMSEPDNWGYLLRRQRLIPTGRYWLYLQNGRSRLVSSALIIVVSVALWSGMQFVLSGESEWMTAYHQWRLLKVTATERDRFRTYATLRDRVRDAMSSIETSGAADSQRARIRMALAPVIASLKYKDLAARQCDDILRLVVDVHAKPVNEVVLPDLVDALRTENSYCRAAVQQVLVGLQKADYATAALPAALSSWTPNKDDTPLTIDQNARTWMAWWNSGKPGEAKPAPPPTGA